MSTRGDENGRGSRLLRERKRESGRERREENWKDSPLLREREKGRERGEEKGRERGLRWKEKEREKRGQKEMGITQIFVQLTIYRNEQCHQLDLVSAKR